MTDYGIKISRPGYDVGTAADKNLVWSSKYKTFMVYNQGTINVGVPAGGAVARGTVAHNLGYVPAHRVVLLDDAHSDYGDIDLGSGTQNFPVPGVHFVNRGGAVRNIRTDAIAGTGNLEIIAQDIDSNSGTYTFSYLIFVNKAKT